MIDPILYWNAVALEANRRDFTDIPAGESGPSPEQGGPTLSSRALAIVHLAMYDAYAGVVADPALPRYLAAPLPPGTSASADAAVAAAAHACLGALYPRQKARFDAAHRGAGLAAPGLASGHAFGLAVARALLRDRANDPDPSDNGYAASMQPGAHRPDPVNPGQGYHAPFYGAGSKGFAISSRHQLDAPPALGSAEYLAALRLVRGKGIAPELLGTLPVAVDPRTSEETLIGLYWAYDGPREIGTPPRLYNQILREVAITRGNSVADNARLFAFANAAMGDAGILAWEQKYIHDLWRPVLGIREHDPSMGPAAPTPGDHLDPDGDPEWLPLGAPASNSMGRNFTPPFPAYPSGHATFGAACLHIVRLFYGIAAGDRSADTTIFQGPFVSDELNGRSTDRSGTVRAQHHRAFPDGLWQMIEENGFSRIFLGVHWSFDAFALDGSGNPDLSRNIGGVPLGLTIAEDIFSSGNGKAPKKSLVKPRR